MRCGPWASMLGLGPQKLLCGGPKQRARCCAGNGVVDRLRQQLEEQLQEARRQLAAESARTAALQTQARAAGNWRRCWD